jgi:dihydrofolate reductase
MGRIVVTEFVTLDGVMEDPGGAEGSELGGWSFRFDRGAEGDRFKLDEVREAEALLLGRTTYEGFAAAWPAIDDEAGFGARMNGMPKYVVSRTLTEASWNNTTILPGDPIDEVRRLREERGGDLLVAGSATLVDMLVEHDLLDELRLMVHPIVLGSGRRLFAGVRSPSRLLLRETRQAGETLILVYERAAAAEAPAE